MKFPWKNVTAVTAINPLGPPLCWPKHRDAAWLRGRPLLQSGARTQALQRFFLPRSTSSQEASVMWWGDAAQQQPAPPPLLRTPAFTTTGFPWGRARQLAQHSTRLLFSLESPASGYLHPFLRERQEAKWIRAIYGYLRPSPYPALGGPCALMEIPLFGFMRWGRRGPEAPVSSLLGQWVRTRNHSGPGETGGAGRGIPGLASSNGPVSVFHGRKKWGSPHRGSCRKQRQDRFQGKPAAFLLLQAKS